MRGSPRSERRALSEGGRTSVLGPSIRILLVAVAYYATAQLSLRLALVDENVTPLWPPTGIAVAAFLLYGRRMWPGVAIAAFAVNLPISDGVWAAALTAVGNTLAPILTSVLLERAGFHRSLDRLADAVTIVWVALATMTVSATVGTTTLLLTGTIDSQEVLAAWSVWWVGDAMGVLVVTPFLLTAPEIWAVLRSGLRSCLELSVYVLAVTAVSLVVLTQPQGLLFTILIPIGIAAWRRRQVGATPSALIAASLAAYAAAQGIGPFAEGSLLERMLVLQAFNASVALSSFVLAAMVTERAMHEVALADSARELEGRVVERTAELSDANQRLLLEIAERTDAERALRRSERGLAEAQAIAGVGSWEWDLATGRVTWSEQMYAIHGRIDDGSDLSYEDVMAVVAPEDVSRIRRNVEAALAGGTERISDIGYDVVRPDGERRPVLGTGRIVFEDGSAVRMVGTVQDLAERRLHEREHEIANRLQRALLPHELPTIAGVRLSAHYVPAESDLLAGGDWYDALPLPDGRLALVIGDVAGHGLEAASVMGQLRMAVRASLTMGGTLGAVLSRVNGVLTGLAPEEMATMLVVAIDLHEGTLELASAGHLPPVLADGDCVFLARTGDPPLGIIPDHPYGSEQHELPRGATLVLFTDGLVDRRDLDIVDGMQQVLRIVEAEHGREEDRLGERLLAALAPEQPPDDIAVLVVRTVAAVADPFRVSMEARAGCLVSLRTDLAAWLDAAAVDGEDAAELVLACSEAASNVIQHADPRDGQLTVHGEIVGDRVELRVTDRGSWREPRPATHGRGLAIIRGISDDFSLSAGPLGTEVYFARNVGGRR